MANKPQMTRRFGIRVPAVLLAAAGGWYGLSLSAQRSQAAQPHRVQHTVTTSCESVGAWCYDAQQAAVKRAHRRPSKTRLP
jgi:hypothetical protein